MRSEGGNEEQKEWSGKRLTKKNGKHFIAGKGLPL